MRRAGFTPLVALVLVAACQELSTTPVSTDDLAVSPGITCCETAPSNPPPPPIDSGAVGVAQDQATNTSEPVTLLVTYFLNKPENSGWLKFNKDQFDNTDIDNSAGIKLQAGVYSGRGFLKITADAGFFVFDLSKQDFGRGVLFNECTTPTASTTDGTAPGCFALTLTGNFVAGSDVRPVTLQLVPGPTTTDICKNDIREECFISAG